MTKNTNFSTISYIIQIIQDLSRFNLTYSIDTSYQHSVTWLHKVDNITKDAKFIDLVILSKLVSPLSIANFICIIQLANASIGQDSPLIWIT
jgi:hypothetical protein